MTDQFKYYLDKTEEIGEVEKIFQILVYVTGLPNVALSEVVIFETGEIGQVLSLGREYVEVLLLTNSIVAVGCKVTRTRKEISVEVNDKLLGKTIDPLGGKGHVLEAQGELRAIHSKVPGINARKTIDTPFVTGVSIVDLLVSLGRGQRELIVGDRKSGKTPFLLQAALSSIAQGMVCVYAAIAKKRTDINMIESFFRDKKILDNACIVATSSADPASLVYLTPYTAMTVAEYFRDQGRNVLIILDDMTTHAKYYREITLLARRFPGRSSYPGDIFYVHASLMERAGNFVLTNKDATGRISRENVSITCLPVAELVMGDLSGYIQTNLMSMTDGHIYFDINLFNEGRRPAINPFLSVTRVGRQTQSMLVRELSRTLTSFLVHIRELEQFLHFGTELTEKSKQDLALGNQIRELFQQTPHMIVPFPLSIVIISLVWSGIIKDKKEPELRGLINSLIKKYDEDKGYRQTVDNLLASSNNFESLTQEIKNNAHIVI